MQSKYNYKLISQDSSQCAILKHYLLHMQYRIKTINQLIHFRLENSKETAVQVRTTC